MGGKGMPWEWKQALKRIEEKEKQQMPEEKRYSFVVKAEFPATFENEGLCYYEITDSTLAPDDWLAKTSGWFRNPSSKRPVTLSIATDIEVGSERLASIAEQEMEDVIDNIRIELDQYADEILEEFDRLSEQGP